MTGIEMPKRKGKSSIIGAITSLDSLSIIAILICVSIALIIDAIVMFGMGINGMSIFVSVIFVLIGSVIGSFLGNYRDEKLDNVRVITLLKPKFLFQQRQREFIKNTSEKEDLINIEKIYDKKLKNEYENEEISLKDNGGIYEI